MIAQDNLKTNPLTSYQIILIVLFVFIIFTIVVDYMTLPALSAILLPKLQITTKEFGFVVSAYAFSAGISAFLATGFSDRFDRKNLLLVYYGGFLLGMLLCATANSLLVLIIARIVSGAFGGVVAAVIFAIVADLFHKDQRGRVMGFVQLAFAASLVAGLPLALYLATNFNWRLTYWIFFLFGILIFSVVIFKVNPIKTHLNNASKDQPLTHSLHIVKNRDYWTVFLNNIFLVLGDTMYMTFGSAYSTNNLGVGLDKLPLLYGAGGLAAIVLSPLIGRLSDRYGKFRLFTIGTVLAIVLVAVYSNLAHVPFWLVVLLHTLLFIGINARMIASTALATVVPEMPDRGAFMALDSSFQQVAGGVAATAAGWIVYQAADGMIHGFPSLGWTVIGVMAITIGLMYLIHRIVQRRK
ncbi:MFS transporter [Lentimicrobium sp.]|jgi:predicted MFS family arabinose efflux permease|uniref:MFS transporter n=1 Tax=Lentimicrobium sp. TaxID=2034841 RepID=UPI002BDAE567|nr:MFS transporter [Lentimicrobium sp.]HPF64823.1 MFS transporter [Lentimicrobium sp.]